MKNSLLFILVIVCFIIETNAQVIHIPSDLSTIQAGIDSSANGDTVLVAEGTYFENINFKGKAITVASLFIQDGDTSHIRKTVIDGSQSARPDTGSVVLMVSGEDTTSVLMGFTITGGTGTWIDNIRSDLEVAVMAGAGIIINNSGGKITHNIVENNHVTWWSGNPVWGAVGVGILAAVNHNHFAIISHNIIRNNTGTEKGGMGGGIALTGGGFLVESNRIEDNSLNTNESWAGGAGINYHCYSQEGIIEKAIFRNNLISRNTCHSSNTYGLGGGVALSVGYPGKYVLFYNNLITDNWTQGWGGGIFIVGIQMTAFNNTIFNNEATEAGNSYKIEGNPKMVLVNNIIWGTENGVSEYLNSDYHESSIFSNNILKVKPEIVGVTVTQNSYVKPVFLSGTYIPDENSPAVGRAVDSLMVEGTWYYAPAQDFYGTERLTASADRRIDIGAVESPYNSQPWYESDHVINVPGEQYTIQAGIDAASNGDTVLVSEGLYYENINFRGKAITVASKYILDQDTIHISRTIINGSQSTNPDTASVVTMWSGEDTTSVLMGFTITGGTGTKINSYYGDIVINLVHGGTSTQLTSQRVGGGIFITGSGGKITNNIIEKNHVADMDSENPQYGGGIHAHVYNNHSLIIRKNVVRDNTVTGMAPGGGGICAVGGRIICEYNEITNNTVDGVIICLGGGILGFWFDVLFEITYYDGVVKEAIIRNNCISDNSATSDWENGGGAYAQLLGYGEEHIQVYNNIICNNYSNAGGSALQFHQDAEGRIFNNTIVDNLAGWDANCIAVAFPKHIFLYNNILYRYVPSTKKEYWFWTEPGNLMFFNNILLQPFTNEDPVTASNNLYAEPVFQSGTYELAEGSPGIGRAVDSLMVEGTWYYAPSTDLDGKARPDPADKYIDIGAFESPYARPLLNYADLIYIGYGSLMLLPDFHKDTLHYEMHLASSATVPPQLEAIPADWMAQVDIDHATEMQGDSITTFTVTAEDGTTTKVYTVAFRYKSSDASLKFLSATMGPLHPDFHPDTLEYLVECVNGLTATGVTYEKNDPYATVIVDTAADPCFSETRIRVIAESGKISIYKIHFEPADNLRKTFEDTELSVYPNPFTTNLTIEMRDNKQIKKVEIISLDGRLVRLIDHINAPTLTLTRGNLTPGLYFLRIHSDEIYTTKVLVE